MLRLYSKKRMGMIVLVIIMAIAITAALLILSGKDTQQNKTYSGAKLVWTG